MSQNSKDYILTLKEFYSTCASMGCVRVRKDEYDLLTVYSPSPFMAMMKNKSKMVGNVFQRTLSLNLPISKRNHKTKVYKIPLLGIEIKINKKFPDRYLWIFQWRSINILKKLDKIMSKWNDYLICLWTNGKRCKIQLVDHTGKCKCRVSFKLYSVKT